MRKPSLGFEWSYRDLLFTLLIAFMAMSVLALIIVAKTETSSSSNQGNILVELVWEKNADADIDLWVQSPGDTAVGYSNKHGVTFNLLRDDMGRTHDPSSRNQEIAVGRGLKPGSYIVNIYYFGAPGHGEVPRPIRCDIKITLVANDKARVIAQEQIILTMREEERTAVRFTLDHEGSVVPGSINKIYKPISGLSAAGTPYAN